MLGKDRDSNGGYAVLLDLAAPVKRAFRTPFAAAFLGYTPNVFEAAWLKLFENSTQPAVTLAIVLFIWHEIVYFGRFLPYMIMDRIPYFQKYKIQPTENTNAQIWKVTWHALKSQLFVQLPMMLTFHPTAIFLGMRFLEVPFPSISTILVQQAFFLFMEDTFHYFAHRAMHWGPLYKHIHKLHHEYQAPFGLTAEYAHTIEVIVVGQGFFIGPLLWTLATRDTPNTLHIISMAIWLAVRLITTVDDHSGYDFPWSLHHWIPFWGGADFHDYHHMAFNGNYSSTFRHWDWIFGTDAGYNAHCAKSRAARKAKKAAQLAASKATKKE
ncbi:C-4 sterol methyl oxidase [Phlyctochytrium bullatum]|nr:C-4 sterol methyl oxidase [Phlyctochytrium bullatum]